MALSVAYLTGGKIRVKTGDEAPRTLESPYAKSVHDKAVRSQQRNAWKSESDGGGMLSGPVLWGKSAAGVGPAPVLATSLTRGPARGHLIYSLAGGSLHALCESETAGADERRIWNDHQRRIDQIQAHPTTGDLAVSVQHTNGTANIGVLFKSEPGISEVTEGDSIDTAPAWVPGDSRQIVYQSAGIGRDQAGHFVALGPFSLQTVNIDTAEMETLCTNSDFDYLSPRLLEDGTLYYIRRPHAEYNRVRPLRVLKDTLLLPFRLFYAVFGFLNVFSLLFSGRKLSTPPNTPKRDLDFQRMMIFGKLVQSQQAAAGEEPPDLVPSTWQLVRQRSDGGDEILAKAVLAYDLAADGTIAYSNGSAVFIRQPTGQTQRFVAERLIEQVVLLET